MPAGCAWRSCEGEGLWSFLAVDAKTLNPKLQLPQIFHPQTVAPASERRGNSVDRFNDLCLKATSRIWP